MQKTFALFTFALLLFSFYGNASAAIETDSFDSAFSSSFDPLFSPIKFFQSFLGGSQSTPSPTPSVNEPNSEVTPFPPATVTSTPAVITSLSPTATAVTPTEVASSTPTETPTIPPSPSTTATPTDTPNATPSPTSTPIPSGPPVDECNVNADCSCIPPMVWCAGSQKKTQTAVCVTSTNPNHCSCSVTTNNCHYGCQTDAAGVASCCPSSGCAISICGNGVCDAGETNLNCPADCQAVCGDGTCEGGENYVNCNLDCPTPVCFTSADCGTTVKTCTGNAMDWQGWNCKNAGTSTAYCSPWSALSDCTILGKTCVVTATTSMCTSAPLPAAPSFARSVSTVVEQLSGAISALLRNWLGPFG